MCDEKKSYNPKGVYFLRKKKKVRSLGELYVHLQTLLETQFYPWGDLTEEQKLKGNLKAQKNLYIFYKELSKVKPDEMYEEGRHQLSYLFQLLPMRKAFEQEEYMIVCWELGSLLNREPFLQPRIYYNVLDMLERYLKIEEECRQC